eukprot:414057-Pelagomonas_calceolata.AAC.1
MTLYGALVQVGAWTLRRAPFAGILGGGASERQTRHIGLDVMSLLVCELSRKRVQQPPGAPLEQGRSWIEPTSLPSTLKLCMLAKRNMLPGLPNFGDPECSRQGLGAKIPQNFVSYFPSPANSGPQKAHIDINFISMLCGCPCCVRGLGVPCSRDSAVHLRTIPACH